jgi:signal transduction histidine kinase
VRVSFRTKLLGLAAIFALPFLFLVIAGAVIAARVESQVASIQGSYLPKIALEPQLEGDLERLERGFQDAVAAHDRDGLEGTHLLRDGMLKRLGDAGDAVDPTDAKALRAAIDDYFATAYDVSRRLIAGETGEGLVDTMKTMQAKQARTLEVVQRATALDRSDVEGAFRAVQRAEATAGAYRLWVGVACLGGGFLLSLALSRALLRSVRALSDGFERFGRGEFDEPIPVAGGDELADLARHANDMAASLKVSKQELEAFSYSVAHDLRTPLRGANGLSRVLLEDYGDKLDKQGHEYLDRIVSATERMGQLIDALLSLSRVTRVELRRDAVDLGRMAEGIVKQLRVANPERQVEFVCEERVVAQADAALVRAALENLIGNAWKFTNGRPDARITLGVERDGEGRDGGGSVYFVRDNGAGFDMAYSKRLFVPFQRLHTQAEFAGTGVGLATVQRIVHRHGGRLWAEAAVGKGATLRFTLHGNPAGATTAGAKTP